MPVHPRSRAAAHRWEWRTLLELAGLSGELVRVGRGGERRAIALANPSLGGRPYTTPTLWAAIQYLLPGEDAPEHRHTQNAFRFVVAGEGVWTVVEGDPVPMRRGDFLPQAGMNWHAHHNAASTPMAWLDGLDIPFQYEVEGQFFDVGRDVLTPQEYATPERSRAERLWGHPGIAPVSQLGTHQGSPLLAYRWADTDAALTDQLELERQGHPGPVEPGHALVRFTNPATGSGRVTVGRHEWDVTRGDLFAVPSWERFSVASRASASDSDSDSLDLFQFSDAPIFTKLDLFRTLVEDSP